MLATVNKPVLLGLTLGDGVTNLFVRVRLFNSTGSLVTTLAAPHTSSGIYTVNYTPTSEGYFTVFYDVFADSGFTIPSEYFNGSETLDVNSVRTNIERILGLLHENTVVDQQTYDGDENLLTARIRCYDSSANALAASAISPATYNVGLRFEYSLNATYSGGLLNKYAINRVS